MTAAHVPTQGTLGSLEYLGDGTTVSNEFLDLAQTAQFFHHFDRDEITTLAGFLHIMRATPGLPVIQEGGQRCDYCSSCCRGARTCSSRLTTAAAS
jgi:hypothetical protein